MSHNNIWKLNNVLMANFARGLRARDTEPKKRKTGKKGAWSRSCDLLFEFWNPPYISGTAEASFTMEEILIY